MINNAFGLIWTGEEAPHLKELTTERSIGAVPFGGRYRAIDFPLSNLVNTGITNVGVITQRNYNSLMDHIGGGAPWDLHRQRDGLFVLTPFFTRENSGFYRGTVDALQGAINYIQKVPYQYCIFMGCHTIYNTSYERMMEQHLASGADITCLYNIEPADHFVYEDFSSDVRFLMNERGRIIDMEIDSLRPKSSSCSMDCMIMEKSLLDYLLNEAQGRGYTDFLRDIVFKKLDSLKVYGFRYDEHVARLNTLSTYFHENMELLKAEVRADLFSQQNPIYTKVKNEAPSRYAGGALVRNSMVADGCLIEGEVENCILFRGVRVARGAVVKSCILMQGSTVAENAQLENVILDKGVLVRRDRRLLGTENFPVVIRKNAVV